MRLHLIVAAGALSVCLAALSPVAAQDGNYKLFYLLKPDKGQQFWMPFGFFTNYRDCLDGRTMMKVGMRLPKGVVITADGKSPAFTVIDVKCTLSIPPTGN